MTNREIDVLIAEKVMGWDVIRLIHYIGAYDEDNDEDYDITVADHCLACDKNFNPSEDISAAWEVVNKLNCDIELESFDKSSWEVTLCFDVIDKPYVKAYADTAPMAISLAALKAIGVEI